MLGTFRRLLTLAAAVAAICVTAVLPAKAETPCSFQEMGFSLSNPPQVLTIGFCDAINITINVSGIRPTVSEPNPSLATTDGLEATEGVVLIGDFMPLRMDDGRTYRVARIIPMREGTAEITFYNFDGSVRAVTKVTVNP